MLNSKALSVVCCLAAAGQAGAVVATFGNRPAWTAAIGGPSFTQTFAPFAADTPFIAAAVGIGGGMQIMQIGPGATRNTIDVPALAFADNNGTSNASCYVNAPEVGIAGTYVYVEFLTIVCAWGADFWGATTGEGLVMEVLSPTGVVLAARTATGAAGEFMGFTCMPGEVRAVRFRSRAMTIGAGGEGFGADNFSVKYTCPVLVCYANCDQSTVQPTLNVADFSCFLNRYAAGDSYANCDQSTTPPVLNVADFSCFLNEYAAGCN